MRVPALGDHPGTRRFPGYRRAGLRLAAGPGPGFCAYRHWASRTRAVSLLTGGYTPLLALYLMKRKYPKQSIANLKKKNLKSNILPPPCISSFTEIPVF